MNRSPWKELEFDKFSKADEFLTSEFFQFQYSVDIILNCWQNLAFPSQVKRHPKKKKRRKNCSRYIKERHRNGNPSKVYQKSISNSQDISISIESWFRTRGLPGLSRSTKTTIFFESFSFNYFYRWNENAEKILWKYSPSVQLLAFDIDNDLRYEFWKYRMNTPTEQMSSISNGY